MLQRLLALAMLSTVLAVPLVGCQINAGDEEAAGVVVLRAYDVPAPLAQETRNVLSSLLYRGKDIPKVGSVVLAPNGQMLVSAPVAFQQGVSQIVKQLQKSGAKTKAPVRMEYVVVLARKGAAKVPEGLPEGVTSLLQSIAQREGYEFGIHDRIELSSLSGDRAEISDRKFSIGQVVTARDDSILADIRINGKNARLEAKVKLVADTPMVLARAGYEPREGDVFFSRESPVQLAMFYVLVARTVDDK